MHEVTRQLPGPAGFSGCRDSAAPSTGLQEHLRWSAFSDKGHGVWRVAEDDPDSNLYAESSDVDTVIGYITENS
jgi:hypothetical protein